jgi:hypothetical protein
MYQDNRDSSAAAPVSATTSNRLSSLLEEDASQLGCTAAQTSDSRSSSQTAKQQANHSPSVHVRHGQLPAAPDNHAVCMILA